MRVPRIDPVLLRGRRISNRICGALIAAVCFIVAIAHESDAEKIEFNRDIRPILTANCIGCHGGVTAAGGISFVFRDMALAVGESGRPTIVPGKPQESELMRRIRATDPEWIMPQPKHGPPLGAVQIEMMGEWIRQGAEWQEHWAFVPPEIPEIPALGSAHSAVPLTAIDAFVRSRLTKTGLSPSPQAAPADLLRRLSLDLTGLPPTLEELDAFEIATAADAESAYDETVERLLASPHFGERWAAVWLDLARYADTEGLGLDRPRIGWPYRDWVIRAYNEDIPFDRFTISQLAGDLLPNPTLDDLIATNFVRQSQENNEGGTDDEEFRVSAAIDRVSTIWETWQGFTMGCAQCHAHTYDPVEHEEFYSSLAFFNNLRDQDLEDHSPVIPLPKSSDNDANFANWIAERTKLLEEMFQSSEILIRNAEWSAPHALEAHSPQVALRVTEGEFGAEFLASGNRPNGATYSLLLQPAVSLQEITAVRIDLMPEDPEEAAKNPEWGSVLSQISLEYIATPGADPIRIEIAAVLGDEPDPFLDPNDSLRANNAGWGAYSKIDRVRSGILILNSPLPLTPGGHLKLDFTHQRVGGGSFPLVTRRGRVFFSSDPALTAPGVRLDTAAKVARVAEIDDALAQRSALRIPVLAEQPESLRRTDFVFDRGNWLNKSTILAAPAIPKVFLQQGQAMPHDRLEFARWLVSEKNPLTARVAVNRFWEQLFGFGLVETLEDFGSSGMPPTHPQLLDFLALRFQNQHQWSTKAILRELVKSATYRQSNAATQLAIELDPRNQWLARGPRGRLSAESVRDHGLIVSGMFSPQLFGSPAFPPMPDGGWTPFKSGEKWSTPPPGEAGRYRRAIYTYTKRSNPYPGFTTFDAPSRDVCTKRRILSNTPLQALETLNSPAHAEFSQGLARRMKNEFPGALPEKISAAYRAATSRRPSPIALERLVALYHELERKFTDAPDEYAGMAGTPDGAAFTIVASVILNLDEALTK